MTHSGFTTFRGLEMWLKWYAHQKSRQYTFQKDPPFTLNHQLISADNFTAVKLDLKSTSCFFFFLISFIFMVRNVFKKVFILNNDEKHKSCCEILSFVVLWGCKKRLYQWISRSKEIKVGLLLSWNSLMWALFKVGGDSKTQIS